MYRKYHNKYGMEVWLPQGIHDTIIEEAARYYPKECGGIFVGKVNDNIATVEVMKMPIRFFSSNILFKRVSRFLNKWLTEIFLRNNGDVIYLGEWHTHPDSMPIPSTTDITAMYRIADNPNIRTSSPLLLIVGFTPEIAIEKFYIFYNNQIIDYVKSNRPQD